mmetsp:Transcript_4429/g.11092  ORF Transcript_4429/g.11092 Transcript_4429/m.11092 type:complete len:244 (-) Transcript_4429:129-860(-)
MACRTIRLLPAPWAALAALVLGWHIDCGQSAATVGVRSGFRCHFRGCESREESSRFHLIKEGRTAGGRDWSGFSGKRLCNACYSRFIRRGTLERLRRGPDERHRGFRRARRRIREHLTRRGDESLGGSLTVAMCLFWWHKLNRAVFDGALSPPKRIELKAFRADKGWCKPWRRNARTPRVVMGLNSEISTRAELLRILCHEMVHQYDWEIGKEWDSRVQHSARFYDWRARLSARVNLPLRSSY